MEQKNCKPQPGDLIEIDRPFHQHWALYMGDGYVMHLTPVDERKETLGVHKVPLFAGRVKKELLEEVVGDNEWRVNNESDQDHTPLPVQEIFSCAVAYTGREIKCRSFGSNCEDFVKKLRYGDQRAFIDGEMDILDMRDDEEYPKPGDLIEIKRGHCDHWALYVGDGYVIHVTPVDEGVTSLSGCSDTRLMRKAKVKKELLKEVVGNKKWRVIKKYDCHLPPLLVDEIIWHAEGCVGKELTYDVSKFKSVDFLSKLRHVGLFRAFEGDDIYHHDPINRKYLPIPGDLIEIERGGYQHWALCMGRGYVIHVTDVDEGAPSLSGSSDTRLMRKAKVKKELLKEVVGNEKWRVSDECECDRPPLPVDEIIWHAEGCAGKELTYQVSKFKSVDFLSKLRHVGLFRVFEGDDIYHHDPINRKFLPIPGDLIEIKWGPVQHWALYMGRGYVIHVTDVDEGVPSLSGSSDTRLMRKAKVKKELLKEVVGNKEWRVSTEYDCHLPPLPVDEIIWHAEGCVGKELTYDVFKFKSVDFLSKLRHVGLFRAFEGDDIYHHDPINRKYLPIPGDLIEIERGGYQHWALCMGRGYVIHVTDVGSTDVLSGSVSSVFGQAIVKIEPLEKVVKNSLWHVNNKYDKYRKPCPVEEIILHAEVCVGEKVRYGLFRNNCEHFVTKLRYGKAVSVQGIKGAFGLATLAGVALILI